ncbi:MAG: hypothetical protein MZV64_47595 [Ignavibacteriales bacterium]|nr:hypothetical protein [Ignavibacteriales bacterium]
MLSLMFSLAGLPPLAGFFAKYYIFIAAIKSDLTWLAILGVISSAISVYFYLRIVVLMYFKDSEDEFAIELVKCMIAMIFSVACNLLEYFLVILLDLITRFITGFDYIHYL